MLIPLPYLYYFHFLQMADAMEMMILSILSPALHCDWNLPGWKQAMLTTVSNNVPNGFNMEKAS